MNQTQKEKERGNVRKKEIKEERKKELWKLADVEEKRIGREER
jgi:hypothetical protein